MKIFLKFVIFIPAIVLMLIIDVPQQSQQFPYFKMISEAHAIFGVRRRAFRRGAIIGSSTAASAGTATVTTQQAAPVPQQPAPAPQQGASGMLPMGKVVSTLPKGCTTMTSKGVEYYHCGVNYYRATFQGNQLVYVTTQPD